MYRRHFLWLRLIPSFLVINSALLSSKQGPANLLWVMALRFPFSFHYFSLGFSRLLFSVFAWRSLIILPLVHSNLWTNKCSELFSSSRETNWKSLRRAAPAIFQISTREAEQEPPIFKDLWSPNWVSLSLRNTHRHTSKWHYINSYNKNFYVFVPIWSCRNSDSDKDPQTPWAFLGGHLNVQMQIPSVFMGLFLATQPPNCCFCPLSALQSPSWHHHPQLEQRYGGVGWSALPGDSN